MSKKYSLINYMDMHLLRYDNNLQFIFLHKYSYKLLSFKEINNKFFYIKSSLQKLKKILIFII